MLKQFLFWLGGFFGKCGERACSSPRYSHKSKLVSQLKQLCLEFALSYPVICEQIILLFVQVTRDSDECIKNGGIPIALYKIGCIFAVY